MTKEQVPRTTVSEIQKHPPHTRGKLGAVMLSFFSLNNSPRLLVDSYTNDPLDGTADKNLLVR